MTKSSKNKIANYLFEEGYEYRVAMEVAKDLVDYINNCLEFARKETIEEILRFIEMEHHGSAMVTLIEDIKTKFLNWKHPMSVEVDE